MNTNGRDSRGRFTKGRHATGRAPGVPNKATALKQAMEDALEPEDIGAVVAALVNSAMSGDVAAAREVLNRACGKVADVVLQAAPIQPTENHTERTIGFFADLDRLAGGGPVTPALLLDAYRRDYAEHHQEDDADKLTQRDSDEQEA